MRLLGVGFPASTQTGTSGGAGGKGGGQMEPEPYSDQLLKVLRQLRARVIDTEDVEAIKGELLNMVGDTLAMTLKWFATKRPSPTPPGAGLKELAEYTRQYAEVLGQEEEVVRALQAISPDFSVEAIDNAILVVERLA